MTTHTHINELSDSEKLSLSNSKISTDKKLSHIQKQLIAQKWLTDTQISPTEDIVKKLTSMHYLPWGKPPMPKAFKVWDEFSNSHLFLSIYSAEMIQLLNLQKPELTKQDGDGRRVGIWIFNDIVPSGTIAYGIWSDGFKKAPSRGTTYEICITPDIKESDVVNSLKNFTNNLSLLARTTENLNQPKEKTKWHLF